jgi:hypothetical protein
MKSVISTGAFVRVASERSGGETCVAFAFDFALGLALAHALAVGFEIGPGFRGVLKKSCGGGN